LILISCPYCGARNSQEFSYSGETGARPEMGSSPEAWRNYLYLKNNPAGWTTERWFHVSGCRKFFVAERHTVTNEVRTTRREADRGEA
jgi:sarcosine oxidase subunit delta